jgi:hypothetical protein
MTETQRTSDYSGVSTTRSDEPTAWVGWILFAGVMLMMLGTFQFMAGLVALFQDNYYQVASSKLVVSMNYTAWGWTHMILGALAAAAGFGVMTGATWARIYAIGIAFLSAVANLAFLSAYPVWGVIMITIDVLVIWALAVHGREMREAY